MGELNYHPLILAAVGIGALLAALWAVRWWRERQYDLSGKTVLITGGSRGLGLVMARELVRQGARLAICARDAADWRQVSRPFSRIDRRFAKLGQPIAALP